MLSPPLREALAAAPWSTLADLYVRLWDRGYDYSANDIASELAQASGEIEHDTDWHGGARLIRYWLRRG
jgi:hypothetical protein